MDFRDLNYVSAIAKHQSISKAAREIYISQPSLTKFLQKLEGELGQPLFKRLGNKFLLTYAGERYMQAARQILDRKIQLDKELQDIIHQNIGVLNVAFPLIRSSYLLPYVLPKYKEQYPHTKVRVWERDSRLLEDLLLQGKVDLAFFNMPVENSDIDYKVLRDDETVIVISRDHVLATEGVAREGCKYPWIDLRRFANQEFIMLESNQRSQMIAEHIFRTYNIHPPVSLVLRSLTTAIQLATSGYGACITLDTHLNHMPLSVRPLCFSFGEPATISQAIVAYRRGIYQPQYLLDFIKLVKEVSDENPINANK